MRSLDMVQRRKSVDGFSGLLLRDSQFIEALQVEPKFRSRTEEMSQSKCCVTRYRSPAVQDLPEAQAVSDLPRSPDCEQCNTPQGVQ